MPCLNELSFPAFSNMFLILYHTDKVDIPRNESSDLSTSSLSTWPHPQKEYCISTMRVSIEKNHCKGRYLSSKTQLTTSSEDIDLNRWRKLKNAKWIHRKSNFHGNAKIVMTECTTCILM